VNGTFGSPGWFGRLVLTDLLLAFESTSLGLLVAAGGGVILGSHTKRADEEASA
jgi:NADH:ubiquinone oxidoreductase subunit 6 (subunit J)